MTPPLPDPPTLELLPPAVRRAAVLRGDLLRCGPGVRPPGWPDAPRVRAHALSPWIGRHRAVSHLAAAWVWGAARGAGSPLDVTVPPRLRRDPVHDVDLRIHHLPCPEDDLVRFGAVPVTSPARTVYDLLHLADRAGGPPRASSAVFPREYRIACRLLAVLVPGGLTAALDAHAARGRRRVSRSVVAQRVAAL